MKEIFMRQSMAFITNNQKNISDEDKEKLAYGLEGLYLTITKLIIIFLIALLLGFIKEFIIALILFNIIRYPGFGFHASKSIVCLISSTILILGLPYLFVNVEINITTKFILCLVSVITFILLAPADTYKRPLTNKRKRTIKKVCAVSLAILYSVGCILLDGYILSNLFLSALVTEAILISPLLYLIFGESYQNYKKV